MGECMDISFQQEYLEALIGKGANLNHENLNSALLLHLAAFNDNKEAVLTILKHNPSLIYK